MKITDIKVFNTKVGGTNLINVKVYTSEPGLYGIGCGTHAERPTLVANTIEQYLKPMLVGRNADEIEKIWQELWVAPYWRASIDANNAMSAIDGALWDIAGKRCGVRLTSVTAGVDALNAGNTNLNLNTFINNTTQFTTGGTVFSAGNNSMVGGVSTPNGAAIQLK